MLIVMGEAGQAGHAARVVVLDPFQQFAQLLLSPLLSQQPQPVLLLQGFPVAQTRTVGIICPGKLVR